MTSLLPLLLALTAGQADQWRAQIREALFVPEPPPALDARTHGRFRPAPGVVAERVTYATDYGLRAPAVLYRPEPARGRGPGLVVVNGHGGDKYAWYAFYAGILYARAGAVVLTYDPLGEGERNVERKSGTRAHDALQEPREPLARRLAGLMITDVRQAVSYLAGRPEVDAGRIAALGYSLGSFVVALAGAVEPRLRATVLVGGGNLDGPDGYWDNSKPMCQGIPYRTLSFLPHRPAALYALHRAALAYNGLEDTTVAIPRHGEPHFRDLQRRVAELRGSGAGFEFAFEPGAGHRPWFVTRPVALWLERQLDFPSWTEAAIRALPETHIGPWAQTQGVALDPLYASEHREGGTRALGDGVPGLSRDLLSVFPASEWERERDRLVYESWLAAARRLLR
jgi:dienelactone hydrolase